MGNAAVFTLHFLQGSTVPAAGVIYSGSCHRLSPRGGPVNSPAHTVYQVQRLQFKNHEKHTEKKREKDLVTFMGAQERNFKMKFGHFNCGKQAIFLHITLHVLWGWESSGNVLSQRNGRTVHWRLCKMKFDIL